MDMILLYSVSHVVLLYLGILRPMDDHRILALIGSEDHAVNSVGAT